MLKFRQLHNLYRASSHIRLFASDVEGDLINYKSGGIPPVGSVGFLKQQYSLDMTKEYSVLTGDNNPIHTNPDFSKSTIFKKPIVHGMFVASLFGSIFGQTIPGIIYLSQSFEFRRPVFVGSNVCALVKVLQVDVRPKGGHVLTCSSIVYLQSETCSNPEEGTVAIEGVAKVLIPDLVKRPT